MNGVQYRFRRADIGLVMLLVAVLADGEQARCGQVCQLALDGARARLRQRNHFIGVVAAVWRAKQHGQHPLAHLGEQGARKCGRFRGDELKYPYWS